MEIIETDLPGIGKKFQLSTENGDKVVIIIHDDGRRDVYHYDDADPEESISCASFNDAESRQIAAILGGMTYKPKTVESVEFALNDLIIDWYKVGAGSSISGKTIGGIGIRRNYQVNVIGIIGKSHAKQLNPGAGAILNAGDTIVVSGERTNLRKFHEALLAGDKGE